MRCHHHFSRLHHHCVQRASAGAVRLVACPDSWPIKHSLIFALSDPRELSFTNLAKQTLLPLLMIALMLAVGLMCLLQHYLYLYYRCLTVTIASSDTNWWWHLLLIMWFQKFSLLCSVPNWKAEVWDSFFIIHFNPQNDVKLPIITL